MVDRLMKVSDLTGEVIRQESERARLVVEGYGNLQGTQITFDVKPEEVEGEIPDLVVLSYYPPGAASDRRFFMKRADFEKLSHTGDMAQVLASARSAQSALELRRRRRSRAQGSQTEKINCASPEHAGEPHRGWATEAEQEYVRAHLDEVNARLIRDGHRTIDLKDPKMAERYGLDSQQAAA